MKNKLCILFLTLCILTGQNELTAQCLPLVSTDPLAPFNQNLPDVFQQNPTPPYVQDSRYLNGFDWYSPVGFVLEPFMEFNPGEPYNFMSSIQHPSVLSYYHYLRKDLGAENMTPQNGWELLLVNLGRYPDDQTELTDLSLSAVPYIVLYNRYRGVIRVFVQHGRNTVPGDATDGVQIILEYVKPPNDNGNVSGLLRLGQGVDRTLDQNSVTRTLSVVSPSNGLYNFWLSGDIQIAYDPCVCWKPSILDLSFRFFSTTNLTLQGRAYTTQEPLVDGSGNAILDLPLLADFEVHNQPDPTDPNSTVPTATDGFVIYKRMNDMVRTHIERLQTHKEELDKVQRHNELVNYNLLVLKVFSVFLTLGKSAASLAPEMQSIKAKTPEVAFNYSTSSAPNKKEDEKFAKFLKEVGKILGDNSEFLGLENFTKKKQPSAPQTPTVSFTEMYLKGTLTNEKDVNGPRFPTPGSFRNLPNNNDQISSQYNYPVYNQALGTFALLEKPKIKIADLTNDLTHCIEHEEGVSIPLYPTGPIVDYRTLEERWSNTIQLQLAEDLKYTFNPALDIKNHEIKAWFEIETMVVSDFISYDFKWYPGHPNGGLFKQNWWSRPRNNPDLNMNAYSTIVDMQYGFEEIATPQIVSFIPPVISQLQHPIHTVHAPLDAFKTYPVSISVLNSHSVFVSEYENQYHCVASYGIDNFGNARVGRNIATCQDGGNGPNKYGNKLKITKIVLKLEVSIEFDSYHSDGSPHATTEIHSFEIDLNDQSSIEYVTSPLAQIGVIDALDKSKAKENIYLEGDIHFDGSPVDFFVYQPIPNKYVAYAWNEVVISDAKLTIEPGSGIKVDIIAGKNIEVYPSSELNPEIVLSISNTEFWDTESNPMPPVSSQFVEDYCTNKLGPGFPNYQANAGKKSEKGDSNQVITDNVIPEPKQPFSFSLFPNPTTQQTTVKVNGEYADQVSIVVYDIAGKEQRVAISGEDGRFNLDVAHLAKGLYLVKVSTFGESQTKQLVIN